MVPRHFPFGLVINVVTFESSLGHPLIHLGCNLRVYQQFCHAFFGFNGVVLGLVRQSDRKIVFFVVWRQLP